MKKNITKKGILAALSISVATSTFAFAADNTTTQTQLNTNNSSKKIAFQNFTKTKPTVSLDSARLSAIKDAGVDESIIQGK